MALSNIFNEPRREIIETVVGVTVLAAPVVVFLYLDYQFALWLQEQTASGASSGMPIPMGMVSGAILGALLTLLSGLAAVIVHAAGEGFCNAMQRRGVHLRPRTRGR